jgi:suppressor for copper-sensitivity B
MKRLLPLLLLGLSATLTAAETPWQSNKHGQVRLIADLERAPAHGPILLGVEFKTIPGWHVYWKNAGDAGYPPSVHWEGSRGVENFVLRWPAPTRYALPGDITAIGYEGEVVYPVEARVNASGDALHIQAKVDYLTCGEECVPYKYTFSLDLPVGKDVLSDGNTAPLIARWLSQTPEASSRGTALRLHPQFLASPRGFYIQIDVSGAGPLAASSAIDAFFEKSDIVNFGAPSVRAQDGILRLQVPVTTLSGAPPPQSLKANYIVTHVPENGNSVTLADAQTLTAKKTSEPPTPATTPTSDAASSSAPPPMAAPSFAVLFLLAFVGGLILNVMPCVLPVLSIKLLGLLQHGGHAHRVIIRDALASAAGILVSFTVLAGAVVSAKAAGHAVGWGVQFQEPLFVAGLALVVLLFALNLWGLFEIQLPLAFSRLGAVDPNDEGLGSYFTSGLFATLLATPCSAPFLGSAVGFAIAQSAGVVFLIFLSVGLGMSSPYLLLAIFPGSIRWLPRPGAWMLRVRAAMGFLLAATVAWLLHVLSRQIAARGLWIFSATLLAVCLLIWWRERLRMSGRYDRARRTALAVCGGAILLGAILAVRSFPRLPEEAASGLSSEDVRWVPFSEEALAGELAAGHDVFLDITAEWCFTCKVNEARVLANAEVLQALKESQAVLMRGDWTNHNAAIGDFLTHAGRAGIPFDAFYRPGKPPVLFSEFLTKRAVLDALKSGTEN